MRISCADVLKKKKIQCILGFISGRSNCIVLKSFVHELPKGEIVRILCWLNSWVGQNSRGPLSCISYLEKDSEDRRLRVKSLKFRIIQNAIRYSDQCIRSSEPRQNVYHSTHLCARTSDDLKLEDSGLSARADSLVARVNLGKFLETSLFSS